MAKIAVLDPRSLAWARHRFEAYYADAALEPPPRFARREFAAFPFAEATLMRRHGSFRTAEDFRDFLLREVPRHVYYSSAYYRYPDHAQMSGKEWLGADVIFDLDADHLRGAESLTYAEQLLRVKDRVRDLWDDFLVGDFGIPPEEMSLVFSGGRGYHIHVRSPAYWPLSSPERRELVEYIQGTGFDETTAVMEERTVEPISSSDSDGDSPRPGRSSRARSFRRLHPPTTPGWRGRTTRSFLRLLERWEAAGREVAAAELEQLGMPKPAARRLARQLVTDGRGAQIRETLSLDVFHGGVPKELLETVLRQARIEVQGETDAPVTTDIHRLIRLPGSLHGGSGFRVVPLDRADLDAFDPWTDAPVVADMNARTEVELVESHAYPFPGTSTEGPPGRRVALTTPAALFLVLRGEAKLPPSPG
ncbi:MAG: DNA primase small subunit PriS [Thermoplasmata archaeon]|nr:DNA primase small subunit PriS [Thermoplasmata archaeon]